MNRFGSLRFLDSLEEINAESLSSFFVGWPDPPTPETHLRLLKQSDVIILAVNDSKVIGFVTALTDSVLSAYIPLLEVLPEYQGQGIGRALMERILAKLEGLYMVDLICNTELAEFYKPLGFRTFDGKVSGMVIRRFSHQSGCAATQQNPQK